MRILAVVFFLLVGACATVLPERSADDLVRIVGTNGTSVVLSASDLATSPRTSVSASFHGVSHAFEGVALTTLLNGVGAPSGGALRGVELTNVVLVTARDGYQVALSLAETDPGMRRDQVILADKMDGAALPSGDGPFRLVVAADLRPARSVRMVTEIRVLRLGATAR
jgi:hypothetical protein